MNLAKCLPVAVAAIVSVVALGLPATAQRTHRRARPRGADAGVAAAAADAGPARAVVGPGSFAGRYETSSTMTVNVQTPTRTTETRQTRGTLVVAAVPTHDMEFTFTTDDGQVCRLLAWRNGASTVEFPAGQRCDGFDRQRGARVRATLTSGGGTLNGAALALNMNWNVVGQVFIMAMVGTGTQTVTATRQ